jgi:CheY-like chemotaxis protein
MRKRVLLVEKSDAVRGAAEAVLRHNGYEVIALSDPEKALEVVSFSKPDLLLAASNLVCQNGKPLYERLRADNRLAAVPLLLFTEQGETNLPFPDEVLLHKPLDPAEFAEKVGVFMGPSAPKGTPVSSNPLGGASLDDDFLDAALGLDRLDVVQSEVMDKTMGLAGSRASVDHSIGYSNDNSREEDMSDSRRVESVMIRDEGGDIVQPPPGGKPVADPSASGQIEILRDQYGMTDPAARDLGAEHQAHGYDWFIDEMQRDALHPPSPGRPPTSSPKVPAVTSELKLTETSSMVDPFTPPPRAATPSKSETSGGGVEKFIDEFKKEVEKFHSAVPESVMISDGGAGAGAPASKMSWEDTVESVTPEQVGLFTRQLAYDLAERIAVKIVNKIDAEKLMNLIKSEILDRAEKNTKGVPR